MAVESETTYKNLSSFKTIAQIIHRFYAIRENHTAYRDDATNKNPDGKEKLMLAFRLLFSIGLSSFLLFSHIAPLFAA